jgi:uncharacterized protein (UPF0264 family)
LVSVRNAVEAATALDGGADLIDIKEPRQGALGRASDNVIAEIVQLVAGRRPVSAAFGELAELDGLPVVHGLSFVKFGLAGLGKRRNWRRWLITLQERLAKQPQPPTVVTVAYADWKRANAPPWQDVAKLALRDPGGVLLVDTFDKKWRLRSQHGRPASLLDWMTLDEVRKLCHDCHAAGTRIALAGSLRLREILQLMDARPNWFAMRGAVCESNKRDGEVHVLKVADLAEVVRWRQATGTNANPAHGPKTESRPSPAS